MERQLFDEMYRHSRQHWWFRGRQSVVLNLLDRYHPRGLPAPRVLDLGCGVGTNLDALARYGEVWGADAVPEALEYCRQDFAGRLDRVFLPGEFPYEDATFDLVVMLDVLEHVREDAESLARIRRALKPGGTLLITVPALQWMWSKHDDEHCHFRRYHRPQLQHLLRQADYQIEKLSYFNTLLFPAMYAARKLKLESAQGHDLAAGTTWSSRILEGVFSSERHLLPAMNLPIGGSLAAVCRRPLEKTAARRKAA